MNPLNGKNYCADCRPALRHDALPDTIDPRVPVLVDSYIDSLGKKISYDSFSLSNILFSASCVFQLVQSVRTGRRVRLPLLALSALGSTTCAVANYVIEKLQIDTSRVFILVNEYVASHPKADEREVFGYVEQQWASFDPTPCKSHEPTHWIGGIRRALVWTAQCVQEPIVRRLPFLKG
jgi:hypothetical protein